MWAYKRDFDLRHGLNVLFSLFCWCFLILRNKTRLRAKDRKLSACVTCASFSFFCAEPPAKAAELCCRDSEVDCDQEKSPSVLKAEISLRPERGMVKVKRQTLRAEQQTDMENGDEEENNKKGKKGNKRGEIKTVSERKASSAAGGVNIVMSYRSMCPFEKQNKVRQTDNANVNMLTCSQCQSYRADVKQV